MIKPITRLLTKNLQKIPLLMIDFNLKKYKKYGAKGSCDCILHPVLSKDQHIIDTMNHLCDYIREKYEMEKLV